MIIEMAPPALKEQVFNSPHNSLTARFTQTRIRSEMLVEFLSDEDMVVQSSPDSSPAKWHLAHTTWFFETFVLVPNVPSYQPFDKNYNYLFNSYYEAVGDRHPRPKRGLITRPSVKQIHAYRHYVNHHMHKYMEGEVATHVEPLIHLGIAHEEQHQELLQMDILHLFSSSPLLPVFNSDWEMPLPGLLGEFKQVEGGLKTIGSNNSTFTFDNEGPAHQVWLEPFEISDRLVTNGQWLAFMFDGGYERSELWLADGWDVVKREAWDSPMYWQKTGEQWQQMTLGGLRDIDPNSPVIHISFYEASAFALWAGVRLPTEFEWEVAAEQDMLQQTFDVAWQWTQSPYVSYPGFRAESGAVGEYNGKFMANQMVLRGGAQVTPPTHSRKTYRNFYRPDQRWMFSGIRLARDITTLFEKSEQVKKVEFANDVIAGLSLKQKTLSPKYFYDAAGSELFEQICLLEEYYPTRTESKLLKVIADNIASRIPSDAVLVEFGSGASDKTETLLTAATQIEAYIPIDISADALQKAASKLRLKYPQLIVEPLTDDFTKAIRLPAIARDKAKVGFFPGSTIGNFLPMEAEAFLLTVRELLGPSSQLIIGADIVKEVPTLLAAYNDTAGVTASFNKNILTRINRELGANFDLNAFEHNAIWNSDLERIEMHLASCVDQTVNIAGINFRFHQGETIHTENSHKFTPDSIAHTAKKSGWAVQHQWISEAPEFGIFILTPLMSEV